MQLLVTPSILFLVFRCSVICRCVLEIARNEIRACNTRTFSAQFKKHTQTYISYSDRLNQDTSFLKSNRKLTELIVDRIILQLNRVYPQVLSNKEAEKFRSLKIPVRTRLADLLKHLQKKGERECQEFYRALQNNADKVYASLPSRSNLNISDPAELCPDQEKIILNDRGPVFFLACFSVAAGLAFLMYYNNPEVKSSGTAKKIFGYSALGFGRRIRNILISYLEDATIGY